MICIHTQGLYAWFQSICLKVSVPKYSELPPASPQPMDTSQTEKGQQLSDAETGLKLSDTKKGQKFSDTDNADEQEAMDIDICTNDIQTTPSEEVCTNQNQASPSTEVCTNENQASPSTEVCTNENQASPSTEVCTNEKQASPSTEDCTNQNQASPSTKVCTNENQTTSLQMEHKANIKAKSSPYTEGNQVSTQPKPMSPSPNIDGSCKSEKDVSCVESHSKDSAMKTEKDTETTKSEPKGTVDQVDNQQNLNDDMQVKLEKDTEIHHVSETDASKEENDGGLGSACQAVIEEIKQLTKDMVDNVAGDKKPVTVASPVVTSQGGEDTKPNLGNMPVETTSIVAMETEDSQEDDKSILEALRQTHSLLDSLSPVKNAHSNSPSSSYMISSSSPKLRDSTLTTDRESKPLSKSSSYGFTVSGRQETEEAESSQPDSIPGFQSNRSTPVTVSSSVIKQQAKGGLFSPIVIDSESDSFSLPEQNAKFVKPNNDLSTNPLSETSTHSLPSHPTEASQSTLPVTVSACQLATSLQTTSGSPSTAHSTCVPESVTLTTSNDTEQPGFVASQVSSASSLPSSTAPAMPSATVPASGLSPANSKSPLPTIQQPSTSPVSQSLSSVTINASSQSPTNSKSPLPTIQQSSASPISHSSPRSMAASSDHGYSRSHPSLSRSPRGQGSVVLPGSQSGGTYIEVSVDADDKKRGQKRKRISLATEEIMMYGKRRSARVRVLIVYLCHMLYLYITVENIICIKTTLFPLSIFCALKL